MVAYDGVIKGIYAKDKLTGQTVLTNVPTPGESTYEECSTENTATYEALPNGLAGSGSVPLGTLTQAGTNKVTLIIYLDGEDSNCFSKNVKPNDIFKDVSVNLSIPTQG